jgi:sulfane dehydrogenase subunit SoxC
MDGSGNTHSKFGWNELQLAAHNVAMPLEMLRKDLTPVGMHYTLTHFDVPEICEEDHRLTLVGLDGKETVFSMADIKARPSMSHVVTMECAGNGRALQQPRSLSMPWIHGGVGTAEWRGTPLLPLLREAGFFADGATEGVVVFTGADMGFEGRGRRAIPFARSLNGEQLEECFLAYEMNGLPLPPQHGFPLRLIVPRFYGMASVKWLARIELRAEPFTGFHQLCYQAFGQPVDFKRPRALIAPPGVPHFFTRERTVAAGPVKLTGRAWGAASISRVEVSCDGGASWNVARLDSSERQGKYAWQRFEYDWQVRRRLIDHFLIIFPSGECREARAAESGHLRDGRRAAD